MPYQLYSFPSRAVNPELGILVGKYLRLGGPEGMRGLQAMRGVGRAELSRLNDKSAERSNQDQ